MKKIDKQKKIYISIAIAVILLIVFISVVKILSLRIESKVGSSMETITVPAKKKVFIDGIVAPVDKEHIYYDATMGEIDKVNFEDGSEVKKDDVLFTCKNTQITSQIESLQLQRNKLVKTRETTQKAVNDAKAADRIKAVAEEDSTKLMNDTVESSGSVESINDEISYVDEQIKSLKDKEYSEVKSPCDGILSIGSIKSTNGEPYMTIQSSGYYIDGSVSEKDYEKVKENQNINIKVLSNRQEIKGTIYKKDSNPKSAAVTGGIDSSSSSQGQLSYYSVKISPESQDKIVNGYHVQCYFEVEDSEIKIPEASVLDCEGDKIVYVVEDNKLKKVDVELGNEEDEDIIIKSGLNGGEVIIKTPTPDMKEGDEVE